MIYDEEKVADQDEKKRASQKWTNIRLYEQNVIQLKNLEALEYHRALCREYCVHYCNISGKTRNSECKSLRKRIAEK